MRFDLIIPHYGLGALTELCRRCLESIREYSQDYRLIFVDNGSPELDKLEPEIRRHPHLLIRNTENIGFVRAVNQGLWGSSAERIVILNNDTEVVEGWLEKLDGALTGDVGLSGPRTTAHSWQGHWPAGEGILVLPRNAMLAFFCVMIRREVIQEVGYLEEGFGVGFGDDDDYCDRAQRRGFRLGLVLNLTIPHHHRSTFRSLYTEQQIQSMQRAALDRLRAKRASVSPRNSRSLPPAETMLGRPRPSPPVSGGKVTRRNLEEKLSVLVIGVYLADRPNNIEAIVATFAAARDYRVSQCWAALGAAPVPPEARSYTRLYIDGPAPKFVLINQLLEQQDLNQYEYLIICDDDVGVPDGFLDRFLALQNRLDFRLAQPARTGDSYIDHPIVQQQPGVLARETLFVECGPIVSVHRSIYDLVLPFDLRSPMGWGYENVWSYRLWKRGFKMGIIDAFPVEHRIRRPAAYYRREDADVGRVRLLTLQPHHAMEECLRVLDVITAEFPFPA